MTLTQGKGQIFPKMGINQRTCHILKVISPTDFIFGTKVQLNSMHSMTEGQGQDQIFPK